MGGFVIMETGYEQMSVINLSLAEEGIYADSEALLNYEEYLTGGGKQPV